MKKTKLSNSPLVSVVIPCYNHAVYVKDCINSVINQVYENIELIIIDDGSKDSSVHVIEEMRNICEVRFTRFKFLHRENRGLCNTLNQALEWCEGKYYSAVASDDIFLPLKIHKQVRYLENHPEVVAVFGGITLIDERGRIQRKIEKPGIFEFRDIFLSRHFLPAPTALVRRLELKAIGYDPSIKIEDWNLWLKLSKRYTTKLVTLRESVTFYRQHQDNMSGNYEMMYEEGRKILAQFSDDVDYKLALAEYELAMASVLAFRDKRKAIHHFVEYLHSFKYSPRALVVLAKILMPNIVHVYISKCL
jgi:alpha-1,3-rhamnosyltransferase